MNLSTTLKVGTEDSIRTDYGYQLVEIKLLLTVLAVAVATSRNGTL